VLPQTITKPTIQIDTAVQFKLRASEMNWADLSDSDSDDDDVEVMVAPAPVPKGPPMPYKQNTLMPGWSNNLANDDDW
jgi:hypothetical protein